MMLRTSVQRLLRFVASLFLAMISASADARSFIPGEIAVGNDYVYGAGALLYAPNGSFEGTLGGAFPPSFQTSTLAFANNGALLVSRQLNGTYQTDIYAEPDAAPSATLDVWGQAMTFNAAGNTFVLQLQNSQAVVFEVTPSGAMQHTFVLPHSDPTSIDLAGDQCTLYYLDNPNDVTWRIRRYDVCTSQPLTDVPGNLSAFSNDFGTIRRTVRILPDESLLVLDERGATRLTADGQVIRTYSIPNAPNDRWLAMALTPDGNSVWMGAMPDAGLPSLYRIGLASGAVELGPIPFVYPLVRTPAMSVAGEWRAAYGAPQAIPMLSGPLVYALIAALALAALLRLHV